MDALAKLCLTDAPGIIIGTRVFRFNDKRTAISAVAEYAAAYWQKSPADAIKRLETIAGNQYGAEVGCS